MAFKKNQRAIGIATNAEYRIESGPWPRTDDEEPGAYLVERVSGPEPGGYALLSASSLRADPPRRGDDGHLSGYRFKWRIHHIDDKVVTLQAIGSTYGASQWRAEAREYFDDIWRGDE